MNAKQRTLRVLVVTHALGGSVRFIGPVIRELLDRGHDVHLALEPPRWKHETDPWLVALEGEPRFSWGIVEAWRRDPWFSVTRWLRRSDDFVRSLLVGRDRIPYLVERAGLRAPRSTRLVLRVPGAQSAPVLRALSRLLTTFDRALPTSRTTADYLRRSKADVLVVVPVLMPGSTDSAYLRAARLAGLPSILCIPSWDNLSSKQRIRVEPNATAVWNVIQQREAVELHELSEDRVLVTGAQCFDHWFGWPAGRREALAARSGLDPERPYVLYVGGAIFPSTITEAQFARRWIAALRSSDDSLLRDVGVLIRPHPKRTAEWNAVSFEDLEGVVVWPRSGKRMPVEQDARADYYDSIEHSSAVVGVNSSAMIESAIIGRPVFTILVPEFHGSQLGTLHFEYILDETGGFVHTARTLDEHIAQLGSYLRGETDGGREQRERFVATFVRPHGLDRAATPIFADAVERIAAEEPLPAAAEPAAAPVLRALLLPFRAGAFARRVKWKLDLEGRRLLRLPPRRVAAVGREDG